MDTYLKNLVAQLPSIIKNYTQRSHDDVQIVLNYLLQYVKKAHISKTNVLCQLEELERLFSKKYGGINPNISKHIKQIRQSLDVGKKGSAGTVPLTGNNWNRQNPNHMFENVIGGKARISTYDLPRPRRRHQTGIPDCKIGTTTLGAGRKSRIHSSGYRGGSGDEILFFESSMILLKAMFNDDTKDPVEIKIPPPENNIKEYVMTGYTYILGVAGEIRRMNLENRHLRKILDDLHKNLLVRQETKAMDIQNDQPIVELETYTQKVIQKFHETMTEAEYASELLEDLNRLSTYGSRKETERGLRQPRGQISSSSNYRTKNEKQNTLNEEPPSSRHVEQLQKCFANASNILKKKMEAEHAVQRLEEYNKLCPDSVQLESEPDESEQRKQVSSTNRIQDQKGDDKVMKTPVSIHFEQKKKHLASASNTLKKHIDIDHAVRERNYLLSMMEILLQHVQELYEGKAEGDILSSLDQIESSIDQESTVYLGLAHVKEISAIHKKWKSASEKLKKEWEYLVSIFDALHQDTCNVKSHNLKSSVLDQIASSIDKGSSAYQIIRKAKEISSIQMEWGSVSKKLKRECEYLLSILHDLHQETQNLSEGMSRKVVSSVLDQNASLSDKDSSAYEMFNKAREISNMQMEWKRDIKNTVQERNYLLSMLEILLQHVQELYEGRDQDDILSSLNQIESSVDHESTVYLALRHVRQISSIHRKWKSASEKLKKEWDYCVSVLDALHQKTHNSEAKSHNIGSSVFDHLTSSIDKKSSAYQILKKAREISSYQMELERETEYASQLLEELSKHSTDHSKLRKPPTPMKNDSSKDIQLNKTKNARNEEPPRSRHIAQLQRSFASASNILKKQMEERYAARLLEELGNLSNVAKRDSAGTILTHHPTDSSHSVEAKPIKGIDSSGRNTHPSVQSNMCSILYANASHILEQMKDKEELRVELVRNVKRLENMTKTHEQLKEQNSQLVQQADSLRMRLSELAGAKLTHDNASIADLSDPNRPTKLAEIYSELYDNQWTDALENLSKRNPEESEETLICCLYNILIDGYEFCQQIRDEQKLMLEKIMFDPAKYMEDGEGIHKNKVNEILAKHLSEAAKLSSNVASANIVKAFVNNENMKKRNRKAIKACKIYIEECVTLCWHMQVQNPPVWIDFKAAKGLAFARDVYREYTTKGPKIAFVVWPALYLHKTGPLLLKGVAQGE